MPHIWPFGKGTGGGGGGGFGSQSYIGTNSAGFNQDVALASTWKYLYKKVVLASAVLLTNIDVYLSGDNNHPSAFFAAVMNDNAGTPGDVASTGSFPGNTIASAPLVQSLPMISIVANTTHWRSIPCSAYLPAGTYWLTVVFGGSPTGGSLTTYYAAGGHDFTTTDNNTWLNEVTPTTATDSGRDYSIRASILS